MLLFVSYRHQGVRLPVKRLKRKIRLERCQQQASLLKQNRTGTVLTLAGSYILDHRLCPINNGGLPLMQLHVSAHVRWQHCNFFIGGGSIFFHDDLTTAELKSYRLELGDNHSRDVLCVVLGHHLLVVSRLGQKFWMIDIEKLVRQDQLNIQRPEWLKSESDTACLLKISDSTFAIVDSKGELRKYDFTACKMLARKNMFQTDDWNCSVGVIDCKYLDRKIVADAYESKKDSKGITVNERRIKVFRASSLRKLCGTKVRQEATRRTGTCLGEQIYLKRFKSRGMLIFEAAGFPQDSLNLFFQSHTQIQKVVTLQIVAARKHILFEADSSGVHLSLRDGITNPSYYSILY